MDKSTYLNKVSELEKQAKDSLENLGKLPNNPFKPEHIEDLEGVLETAIGLVNSYAKCLEDFRQLVAEQCGLPQLQETLPVAEPEVTVEEPEPTSDLQNILAGAASLVNLWKATRR